VSITGFSDPVPVWRVIGASAVDSRFEALRVARTPLLGRDKEIDLLIRRWQQIKRGDGSVVLMSGEPGIGKSRLAETALERLSDDPHIRLRRFCSPHHQDSALFPTISQLERAAEFRRDDTDQQRLDKLEALLAEANADLSEAIPLIADLLSVPIGNRGAHASVCHPYLAPSLAPGTARSLGTRARDGADRSGPRTVVLA
jgi:predicted ATPase